MDIFLSRLHTQLRSARKTRAGATHAPEDVLIGYHKEYPRMPRLHLPQPLELDTLLSRALSTRRSFERGSTADPFPVGMLGTLLGLSVGMRDEKARHYPSAGALYPVETYVIGHTVKESAPGVFHYHPRAHALEQLSELESTFSTHDLTTTQNAPVGSALLVFTADWRRSSAKYGHLAYLHATIESGHMAQNVLLVATAISVFARPLAGFDDEKVAALLDLDTRIEQPLYAVLLGMRVL
jgi:SagB-type dehydrogenase family enzyme